MEVARSTKTLISYCNTTWYHSSEDLNLEVLLEFQNKDTSCRVHHFHHHAASVSYYSCKLASHTFIPAFTFLANDLDEVFCIIEFKHNGKKSGPD
jgi:hypothetical protein